MRMEDTASVTGGLRHWVDDFQNRFNANSRAMKLSTGWDRQILLESSDSGKRFTMLIRGARVKEIVEGDPPTASDGQLVTLRATEDVLSAIFSGNYNPSTALLDGLLEVYSDNRDKVKLEALAMVIWGL